MRLMCAFEGTRAARLHKGGSIKIWSWQSGTPAATARYFVRDVLQLVAKNLNAGETEEAARPEESVATSLGQRIEIDHDTQGVGGSP